MKSQKYFFTITISFLLLIFFTISITACGDKNKKIKTVTKKQSTSKQENSKQEKSPSNESKSLERVSVKELMKLSTKEKTALFYDAFDRNDYSTAQYYIENGAIIADNEKGINCLNHLIGSRYYDEAHQVLVSIVATQPQVLSYSIYDKFSYEDKTLLAFIFNRYYNMDQLKEIVEYVEDINIIDTYGENTLIDIASEDHIVCDKKEKIELLIEKGIDLKYISSERKDNFLTSFVWFPKEIDYSNLIQQAIDKGSDVNHRDQYGRTPLYKAALKVLSGDRSLDYVEILLKNGADKSIGDHKGYTPYDVILSYGSRVEEIPDSQERKKMIHEVKKLKELLINPNNKGGDPGLINKNGMNIQLKSSILTDSQYEKWKKNRFDSPYFFDLDNIIFQKGYSNNSKSDILMYNINNNKISQIKGLSGSILIYKIKSEIYLLKDFENIFKIKKTGDDVTVVEVLNPIPLGNDTFFQIAGNSSQIIDGNGFDILKLPKEKRLINSPQISSDGKIVYFMVFDENYDFANELHGYNMETKNHFILTSPYEGSKFLVIDFSLVDNNTFLSINYGNKLDINKLSEKGDSLIKGGGIISAYFGPLYDRNTFFYSFDTNDNRLIAHGNFTKQRPYIEGGEMPETHYETYRPILLFEMEFPTK